MYHGQLQPVSNSCLTNVKLNDTGGKYPLPKKDELEGNHIHGVVVRANAGFSFSDDGEPLALAAAMEGMFLSLKVGSNEIIKLPIVHLLKENIDHLYVELDINCLKMDSCEILVEDPTAFSRATDKLTIGEVVELTWFYCAK